MQGTVFQQRQGSSDNDPLFRLLLDALGEARMLALLDAYAGVRIGVPQKARETSILAKVLGLDTLNILVRLRGGETINVPIARRFRVIAMRRGGKTYSEIASRLGMVERTVWQHLHDANLTKKQVKPEERIIPASDLDTAKSQS